MNEDDIELLRQYAGGGSEWAFAILVERYAGLVYSAALRQVGDEHLAQDVTQSVFILLARKARTLGSRTILSAWLWRAARLSAANALKSKRRREQREHAAYMDTLNAGGDEAWSRIAPLLDGVLAELGEKDRSAIILRFFENRRYDELGAEMGTTEDAAKMRVSRALEKLRKAFARKGVAVPVVALGVAISGNSVQAAPPGFSVVVGSAAPAGAVALAATTAQALLWTKLKTAAVPAIAALVIGAGTVAVAPHIWPDPDAWRIIPLNMLMLDKAPQQIRILPTKFPDKGGTSAMSYAGTNSQYMGIDVKLPSILQYSYDMSAARIVVPDGLPEGGYDYIANLRKGAQTAFREEILKTFDLTVRREFQEMNVLLLQKKTGAAGPPSTNPKTGTNSTSGDSQYEGIGQPISAFARYLENQMKIPVIDEAGLKGRYDLKFEWPYEWPIPARTLENTNGPLGEQVGLQLVSARRPIEVLVFERSSKP